MKLTKNFSKSEFDSKDGAEMPHEILLNVIKLAHSLQKLRDELDAPITINSGYRSPSHNKKVGGAVASRHLTGRAADIDVKGFTSEYVARTIEQLILSGDMIQGGIGIYDTFVHYDIRGVRARWDFRNKE